MTLVIAEQRDGVLNRASWEAIAAAQAMGGSLTIALLGADVTALAGELAAAEADAVVVVETPLLRDYTSDGFIAALVQVIDQVAPQFVVLPYTYQTRDFAPRLAARLDRGLITDVTGIRYADGQTVFRRPMFQGKLTADVVFEVPGPHLVAVQLGAFRAEHVRRGSHPAPLRTVAVVLELAAVRQIPEPPFRAARQAVDLSAAERIVAVGRGIKEQSNLPVVQALADALGAEVAASRPICDAGWLPMERQVGSSGQTVSPRLYVAVGISGSIQHLVGMKGSTTIVAINKDPDAPIFEVADYGIVGDLFEVVPAIVKALKA